jgi:outer membrane cobalamin receptor
MNKKMIFTLIALTIASVQLFANTSAPAPAARSITLTGSVIDTMLNVPVEYANVVLFDAKSNEQVTGTVTQKNGRFELPKLNPGVYALSVKFIGYFEQKLPKVVIPSNTTQMDIGNIYLKQSIIMLDAVETTAERTAIEYKIDKKVVNVAKQYTGASGTAIDVLENVPAVTVDIEGNVSLRGSGSFQVLIDGRPSILDASDALRQIPASSIEDIEIITNPSAKYDPDGTSGIINIIPKKNALIGVNGMVTVNAGVNDKYGSDVLLNFRTSKFNAYVGGDYNKRFSPGTVVSEYKTFRGDTTSFVNFDGDRSHDFTSYGLRAGIDWNISDNDILGIGLRYGDRSFARDGGSKYIEWMEPGPLVYNRYTSVMEMERGGGYGNATLNYKHDFEKKGHQIVAEADYRSRGGDDISRDELLDASGVQQSGRISSEDGPGSSLRAKIDYTLSLRNNEKIEAGVQSRISSSSDETSLSEYDPTVAEYIELPEFNYTTDYARNIHSVYGLYANEIGKFGVQGGLRAEYTDRTVELVNTAEEYAINRWDFFPTAHMSYKFSKEQQMMASYTRRIERPRGYYFEPFVTWMDAYNVRQGNPGIMPEYIDSYEAGVQRFFGRNMVSLEGYYRITDNKIERIQSVYDENIILHSVDNVGKDYTLGIEAMLNMDAFKWWNVNLMGNVYNYKIEGTLYDQPFSQESNDWGARFNNTFKFWGDTRFQVNVMYKSPTVSAQGTREGFFTTNLALKSDFMNKQLQVIAQVRDVFATAKYEFTSEGPGFYSYKEFTREAPQYSITLNYLINNYKPERQQNGNGGDGGEGMDF